MRGVIRCQLRSGTGSQHDPRDAEFNTIRDNPNFSIAQIEEGRPSVSSSFGIPTAPHHLLEIDDGSVFHNYPAVNEIMNNLIGVSQASMNLIRYLLEVLFMVIKYLLESISLVIPLTLVFVFL